MPTRIAKIAITTSNSMRLSPGLAGRTGGTYTGGPPGAGGRRAGRMWLLPHQYPNSERKARHFFRKLQPPWRCGLVKFPPFAESRLDRGGYGPDSKESTGPLFPSPLVGEGTKP